MPEGNQNADGIAWGRIASFALISVFSVGIGCFFHDRISNNADAVNIIVTVFSVLAGFMMAVVGLLPDATIKRARTTEELILMKKTVERKLRRHEWLFYLYIVTLGLSLCLNLIKDETEWKKYAEMFFLSLSVFVFILSLTIPSALRQIQMDNYKAEIESRSPQARALADAAQKERS